jgi:hypothetical protein
MLSDGEGSELDDSDDSDDSDAEREADAAHDPSRWQNGTRSSR